MLYSCWRERAPQIHDTGIANGAATYRFFTFGPIKGDGNIDSKKRTYQVRSIASFEVRSPYEELLDILAGELASTGAARIGAHAFTVVNLEAHDRLLFPRRAVIRTLQPIVTVRNNDDGKKEYLSPDDQGWSDLIQVNAAGKAKAFGLSCDNTTLMMPLSTNNLRKHVTRFKRTYVTGWTGTFALACEPQLMQLLYSSGLGAKNSQGFGMFEIDDRPL